jgi:hypothetical protein
MDGERKVTPLDESSNRQIWVGWGSGVVCLALAYLVGGLFVPYLLLFVGATMALRGHRPGLFLKHIDSQIIAGVPYQRKESVKTWTVALLICLILAGIAARLHQKLAPKNTDLAQTVINGVRKSLESQPRPLTSIPPAEHPRPEIVFRANIGALVEMRGEAAPSVPSELLVIPPAPFPIDLLGITVHRVPGPFVPTTSQTQLWRMAHCWVIPFHRSEWPFGYDWQEDRNTRNLPADTITAIYSYHPEYKFVLSKTGFQVFLALVRTRYYTFAEEIFFSHCGGRWQQRVDVFQFPSGMGSPVRFIADY